MNNIITTNKIEAFQPVMVGGVPYIQFDFFKEVTNISDRTISRYRSDNPFQFEKIGGQKIFEVTIAFNFLIAYNFNAAKSKANKNESFLLRQKLELICESYNQVPSEAANVTDSIGLNFANDVKSDGETKTAKKKKMTEKTAKKNSSWIDIKKDFQKWTKVGLGERIGNILQSLVILYLCAGFAVYVETVAHAPVWARIVNGLSVNDGFWRALLFNALLMILNINDNAFPKFSAFKNFLLFLMFIFHSFFTISSVYPNGLELFWEDGERLEDCLRILSGIMAATMIMGLPILIQQKRK